MSSIRDTLQKMKDSGPAVSSKVRTFTDTRTEAEKEAAHQRARERAKEAVLEKYGGVNRVKNTLSGAAKGSGAAFANAFSTLYAAGQGGRTTENQALYEEYAKNLETAKRDYRVMQEMGITGSNLQAQQNIIDDAQRKFDAIAKVVNENVQEKATQAGMEEADRLAASSAKDLNTAKKGLGTIGKAAVDIGAAGAQMLGDIAAGAATGGGALVPMAVRSFGSGAQEARQSGATLGQQLAYGAGSGALSVATEKLSSVAAPFKKAFGAGVLDKAIEKAAGKLAQNAAGKAALSAISEGGEEVIENLVQPILQKATYDPEALKNYGNADYWADTLYQGIIGGALGLAGSGVEAGQNAVSRAVSNISTKKAAPASTEAAGASAEETAGQRTTRQGNAVQTPTDPLAQVIAREAAKQTAAETEQTAAPETAATEQAAGLSQDPLLQALLGGKRVAQTELSDQQFSQLADRGDISIDADGKVYQVSPESHIDQRTQDTVSEKNINAFQFDHPELQSYYKQAAEALIADADLSLQFPMSRRYERTMQGNKTVQAAQTSEALRTAMDETGLTRSQLIDAAQRIINDKGQENVAAAKRVELILDQMLTNGWTPMVGETVAPNQEYIAAKQEIAGYQEAAPAEELPIRDMPELNQDGLGAADRGSLNTAYDNLQAQSSQFYPEGANAARPVDVPTQDFSGQNISKSASTIMGARAIPDDVIPQIEQMIANGAFSYSRNTDQASLDRAVRNVQEKGFDGALEEFRTAVNDGRISKDIVTLGQTLLNTAANNRDGNALGEILSLYSGISTNVGQAQQAMSILRKLSPESQLYGIRKTVENLNGELKKVQKSAPDVTIPPELVTKFIEQTDQAGRDAVMQEIYDDVARQVPSTWRDKWNAWRYMSMLTNPRTHIRNIVGNIGFQPIRMVKNGVAAGIETSLEAAGVNVGRTKSFGVSPSLYRAAWNDFDNVKDLMGGTKYDDARGQIESRRRVFRNGALEGVRRGNAAALEFEDAIFKRITYADSLAGFLRSNGVTAAQLESGEVNSALLSKARDYAGKEAMKATYQDRNAFSDRVVKVADSLGVVGDAVLPFRRTPANILARAVEYSPLGAIKSVYDGLTKVKSGEMTAGEVIDEAAAGLTGSGLLALGAYLFASGFVTAAQGDDKDDRWAELLGHQGYALELPDGTSVTLDWLAPESLPFFMGVELMSAAGENGLDAESVWNAVKATANPMLELSMLQSVNDLIDSVKYAEDAPLQAMVPSAIVSYFSQAIPTIGGQIERSGETERMTTYTERNSSIPTDLQYAIGRASSRIPGWDYQQTPYIDAWGRVESNGDPLLNAVRNFLNPAYTSRVDVDAVEQELQAVRDATGDTGVFPSTAQRYFEVNGERINLTAEKYTEFAKILGKTRYNAISDAIQSPYYSRLSDQQKADVISQIYEYANGVAKQSVSSYEPSKWILNAKKAEASGIPAGTYIYYKNRLSDLKESMNTSDANAALREELFQDSRLSAAKKTELDNYLITDGFYIPKDVNVDYSNDESFKITQMSDGAQKRWDSIKSRFGLDADAYAQAWDIYHTDGIKADEKRAQLQNIVGSDAAALYKAFGEKLE